MLHVYGIVERRGLPECAGIEGRPLVRVDGGAVSAVVSEPDAPPSPTEERLWEHELVLEALAEAGPVLPVRFGVAFSQRTHLARELARREDELLRGLDRVRDRVEIAVRVVDHAPEERPAGAGGSGTDYLRARLLRRRDAHARVAAVRAALSPLAVDERVRLLPRPATLLTAAYLVAASDLGAFRETVEDLHDAVPGAAVVCTGPWPPYNFVEDAA